MPRTIPTSGILFDCDGVLVDSDATVMRSWSRWARTYGLSPDEVTAAAHGRRSLDTVTLFIEEGRRAEALAAIDAYELDDAAGVTAIPGAAALLNSLPDGKWAIVTSGTRELATARLRAAGLPAPPVLVTADDVAHGKPHPDGYLAAAAALGTAPENTIVLEDSSSGVRAARNARVGMIIGVGERALQTDVDVIVTDLRSVHWCDGDIFVADDVRSPLT